MGAELEAATALVDVINREPATNTPHTPLKAEAI
jgi:hypothetical protein